MFLQRGKYFCFLFPLLSNRLVSLVMLYNTTAQCISRTESSTWPYSGERGQKPAKQRKEIKKDPFIAIVPPLLVLTQHLFSICFKQIQRAVLSLPGRQFGCYILSLQWSFFHLRSQFSSTENHRHKLEGNWKGSSRGGSSCDAACHEGLPQVWKPLVSKAILKEAQRDAWKGNKFNICTCNLLEVGPLVTTP